MTVTPQPTPADLAKMLRECVIDAVEMYASEYCVGPDDSTEVEDMQRKIRQAAAMLDPLPPAEQADENYSDLVAVVRAEVERENRAAQDRARELQSALKRSNDALFAAIGLLKAGGKRSETAKAFGFDNIVKGYRSVWESGLEVWEKPNE